MFRRCSRLGAGLFALLFGCGSLFAQQTTGAMGLRLAGLLQASAAIGTEWQELVFTRPPLLPEEVWSPGLQVLNTKTMYTFRDGEIEVADLPGLGLDVNEESVRRCRV